MVDCRRCKVEIGEISRQSIPIKYTGKIDKSICDNSSCLYISHVCSVRVLSDGGDRSELMAVGVRSRRRDGDKESAICEFHAEIRVVCNEDASNRGGLVDPRIITAVGPRKSKADTNPSAVKKRG